MKLADRNKVLVVDDESMIVRLFQMILSASIPGVTIETAANGLEAFDKFRTNHYAVILMDLHMPVMDGQRAFGEMDKYCSQNDWEMPAVIFCTGFVASETLRSIVGNSTKHCLFTKPVRGDTLVDAVKARL